MSRLRSFAKENTKVFVAVVIAVVLATAGPAMARRAFDASNADKVDGFHANQLSGVTYASSAQDIDNFNGCDFQPIFSTTVTTRRPGYLTITSTVAAARDADSTADAIVTTRLLMGAKVVSMSDSTSLSTIGSQDTTNVNLGGNKVGKGNHTITIEGKECTAGTAYILDQQITTSYSPFGSVDADAPNRSPRND